MGLPNSSQELFLQVAIPIALPDGACGMDEVSNGGFDEKPKVEISQLFNISRNTIDLWLKRLSVTGDFQALPNLPPGNGHKITDWEKFREESPSSWG